MKKILIFNFLLVLLPITVFGQSGELSHDEPSLKDNIVVVDEGKPSLRDKIVVAGEKAEFLQERISYYSNKLKEYSKSLVALSTGACVTQFTYSFYLKELKNEPNVIDHLSIGWDSFRWGLLASMIVYKALDSLPL